MPSAPAFDGPPARVLHIKEPDVGLDAVVVVDHTLFPMAAGGTRMAPDVTEAEITRLARAMTWKFAVYRLPLAGAKAGIRSANGDRAALIAAYRDALKPWRGFFLTGPDMGTDPEDFLDRDESEGVVPLWAQTFEGVPMDDLATGRGVRAAAEVALGRLGRNLRGARVAVEGFGKAGSGTARSFVEAGARLVAVSNVRGALVAPPGLDFEELLALRDLHGDDFVSHGPVQVAPREDLFSVECEVLVPGARPDVVTPDLARSLRCAVVSPAANAPYAEGALEVLHERGVLALPDFVTNAGAVHLYRSAVRGEDPPTCLRSVAATVSDASGEVLERASAQGLTPTAAALQLASAFLARAEEVRGSSPEEIAGLMSFS